MTHKRTHVMFPVDLLADIDSLVGQRGRSAFLADLASQEVRKRKLLAALQDAKGSWKREDHPELEQGSDAWVEQLRRENDRRLTDLD